MAEEWFPIQGFEGFYEISNEGNCRRVGKSKNLKKTLNKDGYVTHCFCVKGVRTNVLVHHLMANHFIGPRPQGMVVRHIDGCHTNNHQQNIAYGTPIDNSKDMVRHGTQSKGEECHLSKLTEAQVLSIRSSTEAHESLASQYGVSQSNITQIKQRKTWKHI